MVLCFREVSNGIEKKGKKKFVGRFFGLYIRKMIQKIVELFLVRGYVGICFQRGGMFKIFEKLMFFQVFLELCFKYVFFIFQEKELIFENFILDLFCFIG